MKVAITDFNFETLELEHKIFDSCDLQVVASQCRTPEAVTDLVSEADYVITQFAPITAEVFDSMSRVKAIVRYGIGVDNVDIEAAAAKNIPVCNVPDYCINEVADHTLAFILAATRCVVVNDKAVRSGKWGLPVPLSSMKTLADMTVGVVGFGRIGREVVKRLAPFRCDMLVHDPVADASAVQACGGQLVDFERVVRESDVISLHCPSTPETQGMLGEQTFTIMKSGVILVNVARGTLVDTDALVDALRNGKIGFAALDVCDPEPIPLDCPLLQFEQVVVASHIASCSINAERKSRETAARTIVKASRGERLENVVNGVVVQ